MTSYRAIGSIIPIGGQSVGIMDPYKRPPIGTFFFVTPMHVTKNSLVGTRSSNNKSNSIDLSICHALYTLTL
jgi:hypothetical protein